jgi:Asp-tRNA(Asn)/Glu-tRNA(Gln) amidotransferase A subunit family amidase
VTAAAHLARPDLVALTALDARERLKRGEISAEDLVRACLARIEVREGEVRAWAHLDPEHALAQARARDAWRRSGRAIGRLHGLPVGLKDIIDTRDLPTENGTVLDAGRRPSRDAALVARLRAAGAVILGKTETTELAYYHPARTRHPHDPERTPGGSSSGSAAAVAAGMVPLSVGSQTNGSVIRPASFCGVVGFKPSFGLIARTGALTQSAFLDTIGVFTRDIEGAALIAESLQGCDPGDEQSRLQAHDPLLETALSRPPVTPAFAFVRSPVWDRASEETRGALEELAALLGDRCDAVDLPDAFENAHPAHRRLMLAGFARNLRGYYERGRDALSAQMREAIEEGRTVSAVDYLAALDWREVLNAALERLFDRYDAILTPAAIGEAPADLSTTGDPVFCTIWSFCGVPAVSLPLAQGPNGFPVGVQLVGRRGHDGRLLRTARWLTAHVAGASEGAGHEGGRTP